MARQLRVEYPGSFWHITHRGNEQRDIVRDDDDRFLFVERLGKTVQKYDWILYSYSLMTNHYHLVMELTRNSLSEGMQWLNSGYARRFNRRYKRVGHLFQPRFGAMLIDKETYFQEVLRYVVLNPVRANMVAHPGDYQWSSYRATVGRVETPAWLAADLALTAFGPSREIARREYCRFVEAGIPGTRRPWDLAVGDIYLGSKEWIASVKEKIDEKPRSDEFPRRQVAPPCREFLMTDVIGAVSATLGVDENTIRHGRGGIPRLLAAWVGRNEANLDLRSIAAALRIRSAGRVSDLVGQCDQTFLVSTEAQALVDRCIAALHMGEKRENRSSDTRLYDPLAAG